MILDDAEETTYILKSLLETNGLRAIARTSPQDALRMYKVNFDIDLIITDLRLPEMSGQSFIIEVRKIEAQQKRPKIPILVLTAESSQKEKVACLGQYGADEYLVKPAKCTELMDVVKALLTSKAVKTVMKVLIIEDEAISRKLVSALIAQSGDTATGFGTLAEAKQELAANYAKYDVILLDSQLPDGTGVMFMEYYEQLIKEKEARRIPVVSMSGNKIQDQEFMYKAYKMHACLEKPVSKTQLLDVIKSIR